MVIGTYDRFGAKEYIIDNMLKYKMKFINQNPKGFTLMKHLFDKVQTKEEKYDIMVTKDENQKQGSPYLCISSTNNLNSSGDDDVKIERSSSNANSNLRFDISRKRSRKYLSINNLVLTPQHSRKEEEKSTDVNIIQTKNSEDETKAYYNNFKVDSSIPLYMNYLSDHVQNRYKTKVVSTKNSVNMNNNNTKEEEHENDDTLVYSLMDLTKSLFAKVGCCKKDKHFQNQEILFEKGLERYLYNLDIFTYFTKTREIDILKHILLTSNQRALLDFLSKPSISLIIKDSESPLTKSLNIFDNTLSNIENFYSSFVNCNNEYLKKRTESHEKLLKLTAYELYQLI